MNYGKDFLKEGQKTVEDTVEKYVSIGQLKVRIFLFAIVSSWPVVCTYVLVHPCSLSNWTTPMKREINFEIVSVLLRCRQFVCLEKAGFASLSIPTQGLVH